MWRFVLAGLITVSGLLLLFVGSFGDPTTALGDLRSVFTVAQPATGPGAHGSADQAANDPALQRQRDLGVQFLDLQSKVAQAAQDVTALRSQADQAKSELNALREQRAAEEAAWDRAREAAQRDAEERRQRVAVAEQQIATEQTSVDRLKAEAQALEAERQAALRGTQEAAARNVGSAGEATATGRDNRQDNRQRAEAPQDAKATDAAAASPRPAQAAAKPAPVEADAREVVLRRLRGQGPRREAAAVAPAPAPAPAEPAVTSPRERLLDARAALAAGRTDVAQRLLQEAQVQLVFRPVSPSQDTPSATTGSVAAGQIAEALSMLGAGDVPHAMQYINLAAAQADQGAIAATPVSAQPAPPAAGVRQ